MAGGSRKLSPSEQELWDRVIAQVRALEERPPADPPEAEARQKPERTRKPSPAARATSGGERPGSAPSVQPKRRAQATSPHMDRRSYQRLLKGRLEIDAVLDLHGMTAEQARHRLLAFVRASHGAGHRLLLVITGKGKRSSTDEFNRPRAGVLREGVPEWLRSGPVSHLILEMAQARPHHGGAGALYVYLRRKR